MPTKIPTAKERAAALLSSFTPLQRALHRSFESARSIPAPKVPTKTMKQLEYRTLVLSGDDINVEDVPILCKFLQSKEAIGLLETLIVTQPTAVAEGGNDSGMGVGAKSAIGESNVKGGHSTNDNNTKTAISSDAKKKKKDKKTLQNPNPTFSIQGLGKLFRAVIEFVSKARRLKALVIHSIRIPLEVVQLLGKAISTSRSDITYFCLRDADIEGDRGMRLLTPSLCRSRIQTCLLEGLGLTDESAKFVVSIIKAHEAAMDSLFWTATLRSERVDALVEETRAVFGAGLVAFSLARNKFHSQGAVLIANALRRNHWMYAINLSYNCIDGKGCVALVQALVANKGVQIATLVGNEGNSRQVHLALCKKSVNLEGREELYSPVSLAVMHQWIHLNNNNVTATGRQESPDIFAAMGLFSLIPPNHALLSAPIEVITSTSKNPDDRSSMPWKKDRKPSLAIPSSSSSSSLTNTKVTATATTIAAANVSRSKLHKPSISTTPPTFHPSLYPTSLSSSVPRSQTRMSMSASTSLGSRNRVHSSDDGMRDVSGREEVEDEDDDNDDGEEGEEDEGEEVEDEEEEEIDDEDEDDDEDDRDRRRQRQAQEDIDLDLQEDEEEEEEEVEEEEDSFERAMPTPPHPHTHTFLGQPLYPPSPPEENEGFTQQTQGRPPSRNSIRNRSSSGSSSSSSREGAAGASGGRGRGGGRMHERRVPQKWTSSQALMKAILSQEIWVYC